MKKNKSQLNVISYAYRSERECYLRFLQDYISTYFDFFKNRDYEHMISQYKQLCTVAKKTDEFIRSYLPFDIYKACDGKVSTLLVNKYNEWKKGGESF